MLLGVLIACGASLQTPQAATLRSSCCKKEIWFNLALVSWCWFKLLESDPRQFILDTFNYSTTLESSFLVTIKA